MVVEDAVTLVVRVIPRAGRTAIAGKRGDALLVRLAAAPVDGAANEALIRFLADKFDCASRNISIVSGHRSRDKRLRVAGISHDELQQRVAALL